MVEQWMREMLGESRDIYELGLMSIFIPLESSGAVYLTLFF
jgi:hypothetical protein